MNRTAATSEYLGLVAAGVLDDADPAVAAWRDRVGDSAPGMEPVTPRVLAWLSHGEHSEGLIDEREQGALLDDYFRGPRRIQNITRKLGGRRAELPQGDPVTVQEAFTAWYSTRAGLPPDLISDAVTVAERRPEDADEP